MKICYIGNAQSIHMQRWAKWFADKGHEVHLITDTLAKIDNVKIHSVIKRGKRLNFLIRTWQTRRLVRKIKPDILHAHYIFGYGLFGAFANYHPFVVSAWGSDILIDAKQSLLKSIAVKYVLKNAQVTIVHSNTLKHIIEQYKPKGEIVQILWGVDVNRFKPDASKRVLLRKMHGFTKDDIITLGVRPFKPVYNLETAIKSIKHLRKCNSALKFIIKVRNEDVDVVEKKIGQTNGVKVFGWLDENEYADLFTVADLYISTSLSEGGSISLLEAMASGLVPVTSDIPANREFIEDGYNGFLFPISDYELLSERLKSLEENGELRNVFKARNLSYREKLTFTKNMEIVEGVYRKHQGG
jgi:glycosyltransferase involved in cell wall biosynthesis